MSFQIDISSSDAWKAEITNTPSVLQVIDCYQGWCGPCKAIQATFKRLYFDMSDRPLKFYTANVSKVPEIAEHKGKCQPIFLFYKDGKLLETVEGLVAPDLTRHVTTLSAPKAA